MNRPLAEYREGQLWIDFGGMWEVTTPERLRLKAWVMRDHNTEYAKKCVADIEKALAEYAKAKGERNGKPD